METEFDINIQEIVRTQSRDQRGFADTFIYEPSNIEEAPLGTLCIASEFEGASRGKDGASDIVNVIASVLRREYYANSRRGSAASFDAALKKTNLAFVEHARRKSASIAPRLHIIVAACAPPILHFTRIQNARAVLFRGEETVDLSKRFLPLPDRLKPSKIFASIASGRLQRGDFLVLGTSSLFNVFSLEELRQTLAGYPLRQARDNIEKDLEEKTPNPFAGLLLYAKSGVGPEAIRIRSSYAFEDATRTEHAIPLREITERAADLKKSGRGEGSPRLVDTNEIPHHTREKIAAFFSKRRERAPAEITPPLSVRVRKRVSALTRSVYRMLDTFPLFRRVTAFLERAAPDLRRPRSWMSSHAVRIGILALLLVFIGFIAQKKSGTFSVEPTMQATPTTLPLESIAVSTQKIGELKPIVRFSTLSRAIHPEHFAAFGQFRIFWDEKAAYTYARKDNSGQFLFPSLSEDETLLAGIADDTGVTLVTSERFLHLDPATNRYRPVPISPSVRGARIAAVSRYRANIYLLYADGIIVKYSPDAGRTSYTGKNWMKGTERAKDPRAIAIDGSIYIVEGKRIITRFFAGQRKEERELPREIPSVTAIATSEEAASLYAASPAAQAIIEIAKEDGAIKVAYTHEGLGSLNDFAVSTEQRLITVLTEDTAYEFNIGQ